MKTLLVVSSGRCVWDDVENIIPRIGEHDTLGVNHMIPFWPHHLNYAVSWHPDLLPSWVATRVFRKALNRPITYAPKPFKDVDNHGRFYDGNVETSGMYGACIGLHLGYDKIILTGIPFDDTGHFYDPPMNHELYQLGIYQRYPNHYCYPASKSWEELRGNANDRIRSASGQLIKCFGELTDKWLTS